MPLRGSLWYDCAPDLAMQIARVMPGETRNFPEIEPDFSFICIPFAARDRSDFVSIYG
jgi:hypothetical protein